MSKFQRSPTNVLGQYLNRLGTHAPAQPILSGRFGKLCLVSIQFTPQFEGGWSMEYDVDIVDTSGGGGAVEARMYFFTGVFFCCLM